MNIAILIDAENIDPGYAEQIFACAESKGTIITKEIYGAGIALNEWSVPILRYALHTNMTLKPNRFKNCSDIALVIGAMDLLVEQAAHGTNTEPNTTVDAVVIASSDSDYSVLALRLRNAGLQVIGMGEDGRTNPSWPLACSEFIFFTPVDEKSQEGQSKLRTIPSMHKADNQTVAHGKIPRGAVRGPDHRKHIDRVANIRKFISDQLSKNNGQIASATLFNLLNELPDYLYDQQRSKRPPLDYLSRQYGDLLKIQKSPDGALCAYSILADAAGGMETNDSVTPQASEPEETVLPDTDSTSISLNEFLRGAGVDEADAQKVLSVYSKCSNMREVYNVLRKTFKTKTGTAYFKLVKQYKASPT